MTAPFHEQPTRPAEDFPLNLTPDQAGSNPHSRDTLRPEDVPPPAECPRAGTEVVPGYLVLAELGRGGMGVVYKAKQLGLNRVVALKMILSGAHAGDEERARFRHEAEAIARLSHPNIVQVYEVGEHNGLPYFSLEFCAGGTLA